MTTTDGVLQLNHEELEYLLDLLGEISDEQGFETDHDEELHNRTQRKLVRQFEEVGQ